MSGASHTPLVKRLRAYRPTNEWGDGVHHTICDEAADTITELLEALEAIVAHFDTHGGNAPGHAHSRPGIWDDDDGNRRAGKANEVCEWCSEWNTARAAIAKATQTDRQA